MITEEQYSIPKTIQADKFERKINRKMEEQDKEYLLKYYKKTETEEKPQYQIKDELNKEEEQKLHKILYNELPKKGIGGKIIGWGIPILILAWIISGFFTGDGWEGLLQNFLGYALGTGTGAAVGAIVALSHPVTVLVGFVGAWLTVLHPILGIGMFTGLSEAHFKKPKVSDLENLGKDIQSFIGFYKNRFTHILVVIFLSSIGTMLGIFIGIPLFTNTIIPNIANLLGF
jgi:pheromone shutdown protein TraB